MSQCKSRGCALAHMKGVRFPRLIRPVTDLTMPSCTKHDHIFVPHPKYLIELDGLDPVSAAPYACSGVTTYGALRKDAEVYPSEPIVVIGAGGLGFTCLSILKALGAKGAVVVVRGADPADLKSHHLM